MAKTMWVWAVMACVGCAALAQNVDTKLTEANKLKAAGNYREALTIYQELLTAPREQTPSYHAEAAFGAATECLERLNEIAKWDALLADCVALRPGDWQLALAVDEAMESIPHYGHVVAGEFRRGDQRGGNWEQFRRVELYDRRVQLRLFRDSYENFLRDLPGMGSVDQLIYWVHYASAWQDWRAWRLQVLTDIDTELDVTSAEEDVADLPGAPVDEKGEPIFYKVPESFAAAKNDGERWRWVLSEMINKGDEACQDRARIELAEFLHKEFGVQTLQSSLWFYRPRDKDELSGISALQTLRDDETIARLANGVRRLALPDEFNYISIYSALVEKDGPEAESALWRLVEIYENRRQYDKALRWLQRGHQRWGKDEFIQRMAAITGNWCEFRLGKVQLAGRRGEVELCFRNARAVTLSVQRLDLPALVRESQQYIERKRNDRNLDWRRADVQALPELVLAAGGEKYLLGKPESWEQPLQPKERHLDTVTTITLPVQDAGAYWVTATMPNGNVARQMLLLEDIKLVRKATDNGMSWQLLNAASGQPIADAKIDFFGWTTVWDNANKRQNVITRRLAELTDADGFVHLDARRLGDPQRPLQWLAEARTASGQYCCHGYSHTSPRPLSKQSFVQHSVFGISDRPVYRPGHVVHYKFWAAQVHYELTGSNPLAGRSFHVELRNPRGDEVMSTELTADRFGGVDGSWTIPADAPLGQYHISIRIDDNRRYYGSLSFRVEEYKKPEFEVLVELPEEPPMLGDKIAVGVRARYYFGGPVNEGRVTVKVLRYDHEDRWWPMRHWDWFYGNGYGWLLEDYSWYPGWGHWGWKCPAPPWLRPGRFAHEPPEVVLQLERPLAADGTLQVEIDSAMAKELLGDRDHRYEITAEVRDQSRRTIVGQGSVIVPREPFRATLWLDRGYYRVGEPGMVFAQARRADGKPVKGQGVLKLLRIRYAPDGTPSESVVREWPLASDADGRAQQAFSASEPGQYRLAWNLQDDKGRQGEGAAIVIIRGEGSDDRAFRYNGLELIPDKAEYAPGESVQLLINTEQADSVVMLFVRPVDGVLPKPQVLRLQGRSAVVPIAISKADMPNFFVEAYTMANGVFHNVAREIIVPPAKKVIDVETVAAEKVKPGATTELTLRLRDHEGRPVAGSVVVAVYDKSLDYIAGDSSERDIRAAFWKWRRSHHPDIHGAVMAWLLPNRLKENEKGYPYIGVFGWLLLNMDDEDGLAMGTVGRARRRIDKFAASRSMEGAMAMAAPAADRAMEANAMGFGAGGVGVGAGGGDGGMAAPVLRSNFADTALWVASLDVAADGLAAVSIPMPDSLTTWKVQVWAMGDGVSVGNGATEIITAKDMMVRLQAPRFFVQKDELVLSAMVNNHLDAAKDVTVLLELDGPCLEALDAARKVVRVDSQGEARVDWRVRVRQDGEAVIRVKALTDQESDAMEQRFPVYVHGQDKMLATSGMLRPADREGRISIAIPAERRPETTRLTLRWSPSLAMAMVDAVPYLLDYPYGCTEQTLNRFLPAVLTQNTLREMGLSLQDIAGKRANLNAQELGDPQERAAQWRRYQRDPVFDEAEMGAIVRKGVDDLSAMQCSDGGWGWFSGWGERSWPHTTAQVVHGLQLAAQCRVVAPDGVLERGQQWLTKYQQDELTKLRNYDRKAPDKEPRKRYADNLDAMVYRVLADVGQADTAMADYLYRDKTQLSVYGLALVALGYHAAGDRRLPDLMRNLSQYLVQDDENQTAWLNLGNSGYWWCWYGDEIEAHAAYLRLLAAAEPASAVAPRLVKYLLNNRKHATYWRSTRDTAACLEAFAAYLKASGETTPDMTIEVLLDGQRVAESRVTKDNLFTGDFTVQLTSDLLATGDHVLQIRKHGQGPLYYNSYLSYFTLEDPIAAAGLELKVERRVFKLVRDDEQIHSATATGQVADKRVERYRREPIASDEALVSGQLMEIELVIDSKNDYEYILLEDFKAAGTEPVDVRSGYIPGAMGAYVEFRDNRVAFFLRGIARGTHSLSYRLRAEIPGQFSALPAVITGMYAPELRGNSHEAKIRVVDR
ncbi:MAG: MG2 domain-containing protein [Lentisphaeria bacterium]|nr:MG2 domain-containing protein [Lentisphaeria bacterium]